MAGNSDELPTGKRPRKPTEKGKLFAEAHSGGAKNPAKAIVGQSTRSSAKTKSSKTVPTEKTSTARVEATKAPSKKKSGPPADKASINQKKSNEFHIETLPANRTSEKAVSIDLRAHMRAMPRSSSTSTPHHATARPSLSTQQRQASSTAAGANKSSSRRLSKEAAAELAASRNPYGGRAPSRPASPPSRQGKSQNDARGQSPLRPRLLRARSPYNEYQDHLQSNRHRTTSGQHGESPHVTNRPVSPSELPQENGQTLRSYHLSTFDRQQDYAQIPASRGDPNRVRTSWQDDNQPPQSHQHHQYDGDRHDDFDYVSQPRAHARAVAYGGGDSLDYTERYNVPASEINDDQQYTAADTRNDYAMGGTTGNQPDDDAHTIYDNDDGWSPPSRPFSEDLGAWSQRAGHAADASAGTIRRRRSPSQVSYEGEPHMEQGPSQRRRTAQSPPAEAQERSSSPLQPEEPSEPEADEESEKGELSRRDFPKAQRVVDYAPGHRGKQADYEEEAKEIMALGVVFFKSMMMSQDAYPGKLTDRVWATTAWYQAAERLNVELAPTPEVLRLITQYSWNLRGEIKAAARAAVQGCYGFKPLVDHQSQDYNRKLAAALLRNRTFTYETIDHVAEEHDGLYGASIIQMVINRVFFKNTADDGVRLGDLYNPFPLPGLALILTAIQCCVEEWVSGAFTNVTFSEADYKGAYEKHVGELEKFEAASGEDKIVYRIRVGLANNGRANAKAPAVRREDESSLTTDAMDRAINSYRRQKQGAM